MVWNIVIAVGLIAFWTHYIINHGKIREKIDGVETIDGIKYLVNNTGVQYIMYKLGSTIISRNIKETSFEKISDNEGILTFGGVAYNLNVKSDMNIGAAYRIKCTQQGRDVLMELSFEKRAAKLLTPDNQQPGLVLSQAYHRFFKEVFDVKVVF